MLYLAVLDSDDELSENTIKEIKNTLFLGDEKASYCFEIKDIEMVENKSTVTVEINVK